MFLTRGTKTVMSQNLSEIMEKKPISDFFGEMEGIEERDIS